MEGEITPPRGVFLTMAVHSLDETEIQTSGLQCYLWVLHRTSLGRVLLAKAVNPLRALYLSGWFPTSISRKTIKPNPDKAMEH